MNTESRVFNKLAEVEKVELAAQKVDLSILSDAEAALDKGLDEVRKLGKLSTSARGIMSKGESKLKQSKVRFELAIKRIKEIGLEDSNLKKYEKLVNLCDFNIKKLSNTQKWVDTF